MQTSEYRHMTAREQRMLKQHPNRAARKRVLASLTEAVARTKPESGERAGLLAECREISRTLSRKKRAA